MNTLIYLTQQQSVNTNSIITILYNNLLGIVRLNRDVLSINRDACPSEVKIIIRRIHGTLPDD